MRGQPRTASTWRTAHPRPRLDRVRRGSQHPPGASPPRTGVRARRSRLGRDLTGWLFCLPLVAGALIFFGYPLVRVVVMSFQTHNGVSGTWVGLANYQHLLSDDAFWQAFRNTLAFTAAGIIVGIPVGLFVALLLHSVRRGQGVYRSVVFAPYVVSVVAMSLMFGILFYPTSDGPANLVLTALGLEPAGWFADTSTAQLSIVLMGLWHGTGFVALIYLTGLQNVSAEVVEAARVDGAGRLQLWRHILVPLMRPITAFLVVIIAINGFKRFADVFVVGGPNGSPGGTLNTLMLYVYRLGFQSFQFGRAAAASMVIFLVVLAVTVINLRVLRRDV